MLPSSTAESGPIFRLFPLRKAAREWGFRGPHFDSYIRIGCNIFLSIRLATMLYFDSLFAGDEGNRFDSRIHTGCMCLHRSHGLFDSYIPHRVYLFVQVIFRSINWAKDSPPSGGGRNWPLVPYIVADRTVV